MANNTLRYEIYLGFDVQILKTILKVIYCLDMSETLELLFETVVGKKKIIA